MIARRSHGESPPKMGALSLSQIHLGNSGRKHTFSFYTLAFESVRVDRSRLDGLDRRFVAFRCIVLRGGRCFRLIFGRVKGLHFRHFFDRRIGLGLQLGEVLAGRQIQQVRHDIGQALCLAGAGDSVRVRSQSSLYFRTCELNYATVILDHVHLVWVGEERREIS